jgi:ABC-type transport system substrate-binding protein
MPLTRLTSRLEDFEMKTMQLARPVWGALAGIAVIGIAGFASAGVKHRHDQMMADAGTALQTAAAGAASDIRHPSSTIQSSASGDLEIIFRPDPTIWDGLSGTAGLKPVSLPGFSFHHIGMNVSDNPASGGNPLLLDRIVRQALSLAVDRNQLVQIALAGHGQPGSVLLPPAMGDYQPTGASFDDGALHVTFDGPA